MVVTRHRFSVRDYYRMAEAGVLAPDARVELVDGEIHDMSPIGPFHGGVVNRLNRLFTGAASGRYLVSVQNSARLDDYSEPQPDLMLLKPAPDDFMSHHPGADDVFLLIEVADTSLTHDRERKIPVYARSGISEVWIINLSEESIEVYREPHLRGYAIKNTLRAGDDAVPQRFPDIRLSVSALFDRTR